MIQLLRPTLRNNLWKMAAIRLLFWMHFFASVLVPFFRDWGGITYTQIFSLNAWFMFCNFLLEIPTGTVADRFGRRTSLALGSAVAACGFLVYASRPHFAVFLVAEMILAVAFTLMSGADEALIFDTLDELGERDRAPRVYARLESFKLMGIITGGLLGGVIAHAFGLRMPMLLGALPAVASGLLALSLKEPGGQTGPHTTRSYGELLHEGLRYFAGHSTLRALALDMVGSISMAWLIIWLYQPQLERVGIDIALFGVVNAGLCLGQIVVLGRIEAIEKWLGSRRNYLLLSSLLPGLGYLVLAVADSAPVVILTIIAIAAVGLSRPVLFTSYMNHFIPSPQRATILSTVSMLRTLTVAIVNPLAGWLVDWSMPHALALFGATAIVVGLLTRAGERHLPPEPAQVR